MKKFLVRDYCGTSYTVEEIEKKKTEDEEPEVVEKEKTVETKETDTLSAEEIESLRKLAAVADKLIDLLEVEKKEHEAVTENEEVVKEEEEVVDTDLEEMIAKKASAHDSKKSFGSIERRTNDSFGEEKEALDVDAAWAKRYGG